MYVYFYSLHVLGNYVPIIRRINCINVTPGICHSDAIPLPLRFNWPLFRASLISCDDSSFESKELSSQLIKLARKSGQLNLSGRGIASE